MRKISFTKMHGYGNNYVYINCMKEDIADPAGLARFVSDRHRGVGSDGLVLICPDPQADFRMRIFNQDGSEAEMCGNASRCIGRYVYERGLTRKTELTLATKGGVRQLTLDVVNGKVKSVRVGMGPASCSVIPLGRFAREIPSHALSGERQEACFVNVGNPHCVFFVRDTENTDVAGIGSDVEYDPLFPGRTNVEFVQILDRNHVRARVWERGSGETMACGTGACASAAASVHEGLADYPVTVTLPGGSLMISETEDGELEQSGEAVIVFDGELYVDD